MYVSRVTLYIYSSIELEESCVLAMLQLVAELTTDNVLLSGFVCILIQYIAARITLSNCIIATSSST